MQNVAGFLRLLYVLGFLSAMTAGFALLYGFFSGNTRVSFMAAPLLAAGFLGPLAGRFLLQNSTPVVTTQLGTLASVDLHESSGLFSGPTTSTVKTSQGIYQVLGAVSAKFGVAVTLEKEGDGSLQICIDGSCYDAR